MQLAYLCLCHILKKIIYEVPEMFIVMYVISIVALIFFICLFAIELRKERKKSKKSSKKGKYIVACKSIRNPSIKVIKSNPKSKICEAIIKRQVTKHILPNYAEPFDEKKHHKEFMSFIKSDMMNKILEIQESETKYHGKYSQ